MFQSVLVRLQDTLSAQQSLVLLSVLGDSRNQLTHCNLVEQQTYAACCVRLKVLKEKVNSLMLHTKCNLNFSWSSSLRLMQSLEAGQCFRSQLQRNSTPSGH